MSDNEAQHQIRDVKNWILNKDAREGRHLFLNEWATGVQPELDAAFAHIDHSVEYAKLAVQAAFILNGGALAAMPPLMRGLSSAAEKLVPTNCLFFVGGIACAAVCSFVAYLNFQFLSQIKFNEASNASLQIRNWYSPHEELNAVQKNLPGIVPLWQ